MLDRGHGHDDAHAGGHDAHAGGHDAHVPDIARVHDRVYVYARSLYILLNFVLNVVLNIGISLHIEQLEYLVTYIEEILGCSVTV